MIFLPNPGERRVLAGGGGVDHVGHGGGRGQAEGDREDAIGGALRGQSGGISIVH